LHFWGVRLTEHAAVFFRVHSVITAGGQLAAGSATSTLLYLGLYYSISLEHMNHNNGNENVTQSTTDNQKCHKV
jgi:hypothetical protein